MKGKSIMIGVATKQNAINVIPAIHENYNVGEFIYIVTPSANDGGWANGSVQVLNDRNIKCMPNNWIRLNNENESRIDKILSIAKKKLEIYKNDTPIIINLGGGQKPQQFALWSLFTILHQLKRNVKGCYFNFSNGKLEEWYFSDNLTPKYKELKIVNLLSITELASLSGYKTLADPFVLHSPFINPNNVVDFSRLNEKIIIDHKENRIQLLNNTGNSTGVINIVRTSSPRKHYTNYDKGAAFEDVFCKLVQNWLTKHKNENIIQVMSNVKFGKGAESKPMAEYDLLILTRQYQVIALEVKSGASANLNVSKETDARIKNLKEWAGANADFVYLHLLFEEDLSELSTQNIGIFDSHMGAKRNFVIYGEYPQASYINFQSDNKGPKLWFSTKSETFDRSQITLHLFDFLKEI